MRLPQTLTSPRTWLIFALLLVPVGAFAFRWTHPRGQDTGDLSSLDKKPVQDEFSQPLNNSLPDISKSASNFAAVITYAPLRKQIDAIDKLVYATEVSTVNRLVGKDDRVLDASTPARLTSGWLTMEHTDQFIKEIQFKPSDEPDTINLVERIFAKGQQETSTPMGELRAARVLHVNGHFMKPSHALKLHELDPVWQSVPVQAGSKWTQRIGAESDLNPGGKVDAHLRVLGTFVRDAHRFARVQRVYSFKAYRPDATSLGSQIHGDGKKHTMSYRVDELYDINLDTGITQETSTVTQVLFDGIGQPGLDRTLNGILLTTRAHAKLVEVVPKTKS